MIPYIILNLRIIAKKKTKASADLEDAFGWRLGLWNQAYQFALSSKVITEADLKPGDLIFYEADYHDTKKRPQKWDITHIEVSHFIICMFFLVGHHQYYRGVSFSATTNNNFVILFFSL